MDPTNPRKRQTAIVDDALNQPPTKKAKTKQGNPGTQGTPGPKATKKAQKGQNNNNNTASHYEKDSFRIPLFDENGRKRAPRGIGTLKAKFSKEMLLDIVESYGGSKERHMRREHPRDRLAQWISNIENEALRSRRGGGGKRNAAPVIPTIPVPAAGANATYHGGRGDSTAGGTKPPKFKAPRDMGPPPRQRAHSITGPPGNRKNTTDSNPLKKPEGTKPTLKMSQTQSDDSGAIDYEVLEFVLDKPIGKLAPHEEESSEDEGLNEEDLINTLMSPSTVTEPPPPSPPHPPCPSKIVKSAELIYHYGLNPENPQGSTTVVKYKDDQSGVEETVILTASSEHALHQIVMPSSNSGGRPRARLYLKPGNHGWDCEKHRAYFEDDSDLQTGLGHQVDRADRERLREDPTLEAEFEKKYPEIGTGNQWLCGCMRPPEEDESEAE